MASKEDDDCFYLFSDDDSDWDANPDYKDWGSEGDLDAASIDDEIADGETTRSTDSGAGPSVTARIGSSGKKKQLNKSEKKRLVDAIRQTEVDKLLVDILAQLDKQLHFTVFEERSQFVQAYHSNGASIQQAGDVELEVIVWHSICNKIVNVPTDYNVVVSHLCTQ